MRIRPTAVVVTGVIPLTTGGVRPTQPQLEEGIRKLVSDLRPSGAKVALMSNNPMWYSNSAAGPPNCYFTDRSNIQKCAVKINSVHSSSSSNGILRTAILNSVSAEKIPFIDVEPLMCSQMCPVVVGSHLVYFDAFHIFWPYAEKLAMPLGHLLHNAVKAPTY